MSSRFITNISFMLAGGTVVVFSQAIRPGVASWIAFGVGLGILAALSLAQLDRNRGRAQHSLDLICAPLAVWTVIASAVFTGDTVKWLSCAEGLGFVALAVAGLLVHELSTERVVHSLAFREEQPSTQYAETA